MRVEAKAVTQTWSGFQHSRPSSKDCLWGSTTTIQFKFQFWNILCGLWWDFFVCLFLKATEAGVLKEVMRNLSVIEWESERQCWVFATLHQAANASWPFTCPKTFRRPVSFTSFSKYFGSHNIASSLPSSPGRKECLSPATFDPCSLAGRHSSCANLLACQNKQVSLLQNLLRTVWHHSNSGKSMSIQKAFFSPYLVCKN